MLKALVTVSILLCSVPVLADRPDPLAIADGRCGACMERLHDAAGRCSAEATNGDRFGDAIVVFANKSDPASSVAVSATLGLESGDAECVQSAAIGLGLECASACAVAGRGQVDVPLGAPKPLLPPVAEIVDRWMSFRRSSWSLSRWWHARRLKSLLRADVKTTPQGCLWIPSTVNLGTSLGLWEKQLGNPLPTGRVAQIGRPSELSVAPLVAANVPQRGWLVGDNVVLLEDAAPAHGRRAPPGAENWQEYNEGSGIRLCLSETSSPGH